MENCFPLKEIRILEFRTDGHCFFFCIADCIIRYNGIAYVKVDITCMKWSVHG